VTFKYFALSLRAELQIVARYSSPHESAYAFPVGLHPNRIKPNRAKSMRATPEYEWDVLFCVSMICHSDGTRRSRSHPAKRGKSQHHHDPMKKRWNDHDKRDRKTTVDRSLIYRQHPGRSAISFDDHDKSKLHA
jgi:hypothetical protein